MAAKKKQTQPSSLPHETAIQLIQRQIRAGQKLPDQHWGNDVDDATAHWRTVTDGILRRINPQWASGFFNAQHRELGAGGRQAQITQLRAYVDLLQIEIEHPSPAVREPEPAPRVPTSIRVTGPNSRVNINSEDNSSNSTVTGAVDWPRLCSALDAIPDPVLRGKAVQCVRGLEGQVGKRSYSIGYKNLVSLLADHMTILAPFLPALTAQLPG